MFQPDPFAGRTLEELITWTETQFQKLANIHAEFETDSVRFTVYNAEPDRPRQGHTYYADGTNWDPGNGEGLYFYDGSNWQPFTDYEEGTWTPVLSDGTNDATHSQQVGYYTKIGRQISITGKVKITSLGSVTGDIIIKGLPYTAQNIAQSQASISVGFANDLAITASESISALVKDNTTRIDLYVWDATTGTTAMKETEWTANGQLYFSGFYFI